MWFMVTIDVRQMGAQGVCSRVEVPALAVDRDHAMESAFKQLDALNVDHHLPWDLTPAQAIRPAELRDRKLLPLDSKSLDPRTSSAQLRLAACLDRGMPADERKIDRAIRGF